MIRAHLRSRRPLYAALALGMGTLAIARGRGIDDAAPSARDALARALASERLVADESGVAWVDPPSGVSGALRGVRRALVRARLKGEMNDLFLVDTRSSPEGSLLGVTAVHDLSKSQGVDEGVPVVRPPFAAYTTRLGDKIVAVHVLDLEGANPPNDFSWKERMQTRVTLLQQTGRSRGVRHDVYAIESPKERAELGFTADGTLVVATEDGKLVIDPKERTIREGHKQLHADLEPTRARPPALVPWAVDRVRAMPWFGEEKMQWVKAVAFTGLEAWIDAKAKVTGETGEKQIQEDLGALQRRTEPTTFADPEIGWPPPALTPIISPALAGEGKWIPTDGDPFITPQPGLPSPFVTTFVRADPKRSFTRVYVTLWDPRQVGLHMEAGTIEPVSATGEAGPGVIPRTPEVLRRVVAGFNGGFQATHGEFGMQANGTLYLPPKPFAATVMELTDGSAAFGTWPRSSDVPPDVLSFRQNLTALVENGTFNPYKRTWWGGTPVGWPDNIHTTRSGLCITSEGFLAYFYGVDMAPDILANGMLAARCSYGMHLDMNPGLVGFEFYNVSPKAAFAPLGRPLQQDWEAEGVVKELDDFAFRARRMVKTMSHMNFPQYLHRDGRDFFYLTLRHVLPGVPLAAAKAPGGVTLGAGGFRTKGLPQHGFPYAMAAGAAEVDGVPLSVVLLDPRVVRPAVPSGSSAEATPASAPTVALVGTPIRSIGTAASATTSPTAPTGGKRTRPSHLYLTATTFLLGDAPPVPATALARVFPASPEAARESRAAVGIRDEDGALVWVELGGARESAADDALWRKVDAWLADNGCSARGLVGDGVRLFPGGALDASAANPAKIPPSGDAIRLVRGPAPSASRRFETREIVPPEVWQPLQAQRVRYFKKGVSKSAGAAASAAASGSAPPTASASPAPSR